MKTVSTLFVCLLVVVDGFSLEKCFEKDSISCIQIEVFEAARDILHRSTFNLWDILTVKKDVEERSGKSLLKEIELERTVLDARGVENRQVAMEKYFSTQFTHLLDGTSIEWRSDGILDALGKFVPDKFASYEESRAKSGGKKKKSSQLLLPLLIAIKLKMATFAALAYMFIGVIAKKAVLAGIISLLLSGFIATKNLIETHKTAVNSHQAWEFQGPMVHSQGYDREGEALLAAASNAQPVQPDNLKHRRNYWV